MYVQVNITEFRIICGYIVIFINTYLAQPRYMLSKCRNGELFGNGILPTEIRYPKRDVFRLHHKQKAAIFSGKDSLRKSRSGVTNAQNNIWVKRNSKEHFTLKSSEKPKYYDEGDFFEFEHSFTANEPSVGNTISRNEKEIYIHNGQEYNDYVKKDEILRRNVSNNLIHRTLPCKKRKISSSFDTSDDTFPSNERYEDSLLKNSFSHENEFMQQDDHCKYHYNGTLKGNQFNPSENDTYAVVNKFPKTKMVGIEEKLDVSSERPVVIENHCVSAPVVPISNSRNKSNNPTNYVPQPISQISSLPLLQEINLPNQNTKNNKHTARDTNGHMVAPPSMNHIDETNGSKESTPPRLDSASLSKFKLPSSFEMAILPSGILQYSSSSKSCIRYRKALAISSLAFSTIMIMTFAVLYWNYHEALHRRMTKNVKGPILDHWGKVSLHRHLFI